MTRLSDIHFPPVLDTSSGDIIRDFFNPALAASVRYDRGVGFFSASWLRLAAKGMTEFAANNGLARWVTSPILGYQSKASWFAKLNSMVMDFSSAYREHFAVITTPLSKA